MLQNAVVFLECRLAWGLKDFCLQALEPSTVDSQILQQCTLRRSCEECGPPTNLLLDKFSHETTCFEVHMRSIHVGIMAELHAQKPVRNGVSGCLGGAQSRVPEKTSQLLQVLIRNTRLMLQMPPHQGLNARPCTYRRHLEPYAFDPMS